LPVLHLNELCRYCGALEVLELKRGDVSAWVESHPTWRSPVTRRNVITTVLAAFHHAETEHGVRSPLKGLKKPPQRPRLSSLTPEEGRAIYGATDEAFRNFHLWARGYFFVASNGNVTDEAIRKCIRQQEGMEPDAGGDRFRATPS